MKRVVLILVIAGFVVMGSLGFSHTLYADCGSAKTHCCIDGDRSKTVAITTFSLCWSWKHLQCRPCHGGAEWSYLAKWCNDNYEKCRNKCWACFDANDCCFDKQGKAYNCYNQEL